MKFSVHSNKRANMKASRKIIQIRRHFPLKIRLTRKPMEQTLEACPQLMVVVVSKRNEVAKDKENRKKRAN